MALSDNVWRCRNSDIEERVARLLPGMEPWEALILLDQIVTPIADRGEDRLGWQT